MFIGYWLDAPEASIPNVGSSFAKMFMGSGTRHRVDLLKGLTGRILPGKLTLVLGPPGSGMYICLFLILLYPNLYATLH